MIGQTGDTDVQRKSHLALRLASKMQRFQWQIMAFRANESFSKHPICFTNLNPRPLWHINPKPQEDRNKT